MSRPRLLRTIVLVVAVAIASLLLVALASTDWLASFGGKSDGPRRARLEQSPNFRDGKFRNPVPSNMLVPGSFFTMLRHQLFGDEVRVPAQPLAVVARAPGDYAVAPPSGLRATWIGHASTLVEIDGSRILFDPIFSERCSPSTMFGPRRFHPPPIALNDLPPIDAVMISHDHFDHLDMVTATTLAARGTHFVVPLGIGAHLEAWKIAPAQITELDWWQTTTKAGLSITSTPARHYSGRNPLRSDQALWSSWVVAGSAHKVYFSGDTGYFDGFRAIGAKHGPFDLTLIKVGASDPTWIDIHMSPEEAVKAHQDLGGKLLLPVHWGTFNLAFHAWNEPAQRVTAAALKAGVAITVPQPGQFVEPGTPPPLRQWWQ